jgi:Ca2+-transporting ATPase
VLNRGESEIQNILRDLETNSESGLSEVEAYDRLRKYGTNELDRPYLFYQHVRSIGLVCLAVGIVLAVEYDLRIALGLAILSVVMIIASSVLKRRYRQSLISSGGQYLSVCTGIRGGKLLQLAVSTLVPGDIVRIQARETIPADGRLTEAISLIVQEEVLSGNSEPVTKHALQLNDLSVLSEENQNRVFMNTLVIHGRGTFVVTETGKNTRIGKSKTPAQ